MSREKWRSKRLPPTNKEQKVEVMTDARDIVEPETFSRAIVHLQKELQQSLDDAASLRKQLDDAREALIQADLTIRSFKGADQSDVEFIREALKGKS